jgi:acyl carrier protein
MIHDLWDFQDYHDKKENYQKFCGGPGGGFSKEPPGRRRRYKTGDLARWQPDGNIEFLGRMDRQIKIRGFRVEPGEVESRLLNHESVKEAVVLVKEGETGERYLCAYAAAAPGKRWDPSGLRMYLARELPDYMVPSYFISIDRIPLTPNGKVDRRQLPVPGVQTGEDYAAPRDEVEERLVEVWSEVLGVGKEVIGIDANFFELGGHSLKAVTLVSKIHKEFNVKLPLTEVFKSMTIRGVSSLIALLNNRDV